MSTLSKLKRQNEKLRNLLKNKQQLLEIGRERNRLLKENKTLRMLHKHPGLISFSQTSGKIGKKVGTGLMKWARRMAEAEKREEMMRKKMISPRRKSSSKRKRR